MKPEQVTPLLRWLLWLLEQTPKALPGPQTLGICSRPRPLVCTPDCPPLHSSNASHPARTSHVLSQGLLFVLPGCRGTWQLHTAAPRPAPSPPWVPHKHRLLSEASLSSLSKATLPPTLPPALPALLYFPPCPHLPAPPSSYVVRLPPQTPRLPGGQEVRLLCSRPGPGPTPGPRTSQTLSEPLLQEAMNERQSFGLFSVFCY